MVGENKLPGLLKFLGPFVSQSRMPKKRRYFTNQRKVAWTTRRARILRFAVGCTKRMIPGKSRN